MQQIPRNTSEGSFWMIWARRLIRLYPAGWRERYADEILALLEECPPTFWTLVDLLFSLSDAHLHSDLVSGRTSALVKQFYTSIATVLSVGLLFYLVSKYMLLNSIVAAPGNAFSDMVFPPLALPIASVLRRLTSVLSISLVCFGAGVLLSTGWQAFKTRRLLSFALSACGVLCPALLFLLHWENDDMFRWYEDALVNSHFLQHLAAFLSFHNYSAFVYPFMGICAYVIPLLVSLLFVKMGGRLWRMAPRQVVPGLRSAKLLLTLATLCATLLFLYCSTLLFLMVYTSLAGFGHDAAYFFNAWWLLVLLPVMVLLVATSLARAYQAQHGLCPQSRL